MNTSTRRILLAISGVVLLVCLCAIGAGFFGAGYFFTLRSESEPIVATAVVVATQFPDPDPTKAPQESELIDPTSEATETQVTSEEPIPQDTSTPTGSDLPLEIARQMDRIQEQVVTLRGLQPNGSVDRALLTQDQLRQHVTEDFLRVF
jgi:hypothetical protein